MESRIDAVSSELVLTKVYGNSMFPTIKNGERVLVKKVLNKDLRRGDIILIKKDLLKICHRIVNMDREKGVFGLKGDFNLKKDEEVKAEVVLGKVVALVSGDKMHPLKFQNTFLYYFGISSIVFLKEAASFLLNRLYSFCCLRRVLKKLSSNQIKCFEAKTEEDRELFYSLYNFIPEQLSSFCIAEMILGFYGGKFVGKLWVLEDKANGNFWLWGPYVKVLYRARNVGSSLIKKAVDSLKNRDVKSAVYADIPPSKALMMCFRKSGFLLSVPLKQNSL